MYKIKHVSSTLQATRALFEELDDLFPLAMFCQDEHIKKDKMGVACAIHVEVGEGGSNTYDILVGKPDGKNRVALITV